MAAKMCAANKVAAKKRQGCIYYLKNLQSGKGYVGQHATSEVERRWNGHITAAARGSRLAIHAAVRKYGVENFSAEVVWRGSTDQLNDKECFYIKKLGTFIDTGKGYNLTTGGGQFEMSQSSKRAIAKAVSMQWKDAKFRSATCDAISKANFVRYQDPEQRAKRVEVMRRLWQDPDYRAKMTQSLRGRKFSENGRAIMAQALERTRTRPGYGERLSAAQKLSYANDPARRDVNRTPKCRAAARERTLRQFASQEARDAVSQQNNRLWADQTYRVAQTAKIAAGKARKKTERLAAANGNNNSASWPST